MGAAQLERVTAWLASRAPRLAEREAFLKLPDSVEPRCFGELGLSLDVDATIDAMKRAYTPARSRRGSIGSTGPIRIEDVPLVFRFDAGGGATRARALPTRRFGRSR